MTEEFVLEAVAADGRAVKQYHPRGREFVCREKGKVLAVTPAAGRPLPVPCCPEAQSCRSCPDL